MLRFGLVTLLIVGLAGCAPGKDRECRAVSETIRAGQAAFTDMPGDPDLQKLAAQATQADTFAKSLETIRVKDPQLAALVEAYRAMAADMAGLLREASKGDMGMDVYTKRAEALQKTDDDLVARINGYCKLEPAP